MTTSPSNVNNETLQPVTVIGLGPMGQALAGAFLGKGHPVTVWNRTAAKADTLVSQGAVRAETVSEAIAASPLVLICVLDYNAVRSILASSADALSGRTLVNLTADTPANARQTAAWAAEHDIAYLDGAIMTPTPTIGTSDAVVLYSGPEEVFEAHRSTLASIGGTASYLGEDPGRAAAYDVALLDLYWTTMSGYAHSLALARTEQISARELAVFAKGIAAILPDIMTLLADQMDEGQYPGDASNLLSAAAGMEHIIQAAEDRGIDASVMKAAKALAQRAIDAGYGSGGFLRIAEMIGLGPSKK